MTPNEVKPSFDGLGIAPAILDTLNRAQFTVPTPIQLQAIPPGITGKDVVGIAQTGTGKTLAFVVPIMQRLQQNRGIALVVVPTRELALQVEETAERIGRGCGIRSVVLMGGTSMHMQTQRLRQSPRLIVATPGRLLDHMQQRNISLKTVTIAVLDEADRMFDMGFMPAIQKIFAAMPPAAERQTMLFSATMPPDIMKLAANYMQLPVRVEVVQPGTTADRVSQEIIFVHKDDKMKLLGKVLLDTTGAVLVFSRTKHGARKMAMALRNENISAAEIHSDRSLGQRREALEGFKRGKYRVLVATDIAARGIDVKGIEMVINFDLPDSSDDYVHRIGRTGRAGHTGRAVSFATPDQRSDVRAIENLIRMPLPITHVPDISVTGGFGGGSNRPHGAFGNSNRPPQQRPGGRPAMPRRQFGGGGGGPASAGGPSNGPRRNSSFPGRRKRVIM